ncbi:unnamed protein product [Arabidopsis halleri]
MVYASHLEVKGRIQHIEKNLWICICIKEGFLMNDYENALLT